MTRLSRATLDQVPAAVAAPRDRPPMGTGIVHFGPGAFHRAHQAAYVDRLLDTDPRWGIAAVSLRSRGTVERLVRQDGLYTLAIRDCAPNIRVIGAHTALLGPDDANAILAALSEPGVSLVTTTVTEKGYCLLPSGQLDLSHPDIAHDLGSANPRSVVGWIVAGLSRRRRAGLSPFVVMPCDNLANNGAKVAAALIAFAAERDKALADWIAREVRVPATMVDSITPASDEALVADVAAAIGLEDRAPVQREAFAQWVVQDVGDLGPDLASVGVDITHDVAGYERAKLRVLNGAHSTLAYAGLLRGHTTVAEAMRDGELADFVAGMIQKEIVPTLGRVPGLDLSRYCADVLARFRNPTIVHRLEQIAHDGSQKLPYRLGDTLAVHRASGGMPRRVVTAMGMWAAFAWVRTRAGEQLIDPAGDAIARAAHGTEPAAFVRRLASQDCGIPRSALDDEDLIRTLGKACALAVVDAGDLRRACQ